jgi:signal transduction histidine kinase
MSYTAHCRRITILQNNVPEEKRTPASMNLLIVDDHAVNRKFLRASLEDSGHSVTEATNGIEALSVLKQERVDAVISDVLMPAMDGFRLCREIRKSESLRELPVVLYTSTYHSRADREHAKSVGADSYILKPAPANMILDAVSAAAQRPHERDERAEPAEDSEVLERYNAVLVRKLEARNAELENALNNLQSAHADSIDLNRTLETRVAQRTAALDAANRELEAFSYSISHELCAPLERILDYTQTLERESSGVGDARQALEQIKASTVLMNSLVHGLLEFARMGRVDLDLQVVSVDGVVNEALEALKDEMRGRIIEWRRHTLPSVQADRALLLQALVNLLSNALKFTRSRHRAVIEIGERKGRAGEVVLYIKDNGVGFDLQRSKELFGIFKRLSNAKEVEGIGIGLANAHRIITRHGGFIWADAAPGAGATFYFSLRRI